MTLFAFLRDDKIGLDISICATCEIAEVAFTQKLMVVIGLIVELFSDKNILLVNGITFTKGLGKGGQQIGKLIIVINIGRVLASLSIEYTDDIHILHGEVDVLKYLLALTTCTESLDGGKHTQEDCCKCYEYVPNHNLSISSFSAFFLRLIS